jgi:uncharacterized membrane protein
MDKETRTLGIAAGLAALAGGAYLLVKGSAPSGTSGPITITLDAPQVNLNLLTLNGVATDTAGVLTAGDFTFNAGDGNIIQGSNFPFTHTYAKAGTYTVTVTATDSMGNTNSASTTVTIVYQAPPMVNPKATISPLTLTITSSSITVTGSGFSPNGGVIFNLYSDVAPYSLVWYYTATADSGGNVNFTIPSPNMVALFAAVNALNPVQSRFGATVVDALTNLGTQAVTMHITLVTPYSNGQITVTNNEPVVGDMIIFNVSGLAVSSQWALYSNELGEGGVPLTATYPLDSSGNGSLSYLVSTNSPLYIYATQGAGTSRYAQVWGQDLYGNKTNAITILMLA